MSNKTKYLDIKQAMTFTGKSQSTIRNLLRSLSESDRQKYTKRKGKKIYISQSLLEERYGQNDEPVTPLEQSVLETVKILREQLNTKDEVIKELMERLKEANYNQGSLYRLLERLDLDDNEIQKMIK